MENTRYDLFYEDPQQSQCCRTVRFDEMSSVSSCLLLCVLWVTIFNGVLLAKTEDVLDKIKAGLQYATNYLETAKDIADLVSKSLGHKQRRGEDRSNEAKQSFGPSNLVSAFFRLFGLDSPKVAAIAINSVIFLAQMISSLFGLKLPQSNNARNIANQNLSWDPLKFILDNKNEKIRNLVDQAKDPNLPNHLIASMSSSDSACIRLLLCKSSLVIRTAQNTLNDKSQNYIQGITAWLPSIEEFEANSDVCENKHIDCNLFLSQ